MTRQRIRRSQRPEFLILALFLSAFSLLFIDAALIGDEQFGRVEGGAFWVFTSDGVSIVNPDTCQIDHNFHHDNTHNALPSRWSKGVYMVRQTPNEFEDDDVPLTDTPELLPSPDGYILIGSGETRTVSSDDPAALTQVHESEVVVLDTTSASKTPVLRRIPVGGALGNAYGVHNRNQFWTHSSADGFFYVIDLNILKEGDASTGHPVKAKITTATDKGHLLWEMGIEDETLSLKDTAQIGYATSRSVSELFILDLQYHKQVAVYDFGKDANDGTCAGAASLAFSKTNQHLYIQCTPTGGTLEYDVSHPASPLFVQQHAHVGGTLLETPDQVYVTATDKGANRMTFFAPTQTGEPSQTDFTITVKGHPEAPVFYESPETLDYIACMPLTENLNRAHRKDANDDDPVVCDYHNDCTGAISASDAEHGKCLHDAKNPTLLQSATPSDLRTVQNKSAPFFEACGLCELPQDYENPQGECVCTPRCGACANDHYPKSPQDALLQTTGVMCVDVKDAMLGVLHHSDLIEGAGAIVQPKAKDNPNFQFVYGVGVSVPECALDEPVRSHKKGGRIYDASISTVPSRELIVVDMRVESLKCRVELPGVPQEVVYVPTNHHYKHGDGLGGGSGGSLSPAWTAIIVVISVLVFVVLAAIPGSRFAKQQRDIHDSVAVAESNHDAANGTKTNGNIEMTTNANANGAAAAAVANGNGYYGEHPEESKHEDTEPSHEYQYGDKTFVIDDDAPDPMPALSTRSSAADPQQQDPAASVRNGQLA